MAPSRVDDGISNGLDKVDHSGIPYSYPCYTQSPSETKAYKGDPAEINLGWHKVIPRWKANSIIKWRVDPDNFPESDDASYAAEQLEKAAQSWNNLNLGVKFERVDDRRSAVFALQYNGWSGRTLAKAFFPNEALSNYLDVYGAALESNAKGYLDKVFQHELGHVLGLRHEFAAEEGDYVLFGEKNPSSVMTYRWPPVLTEQDKKETQQFYAWTKPEISSEVNTYQVVDQSPKGLK